MVRWGSLSDHRLLVLSSHGGRGQELHGALTRVLIPFTRAPPHGLLASIRTYLSYHYIGR